jgi:hypothetical protein
MPVLTIEEIKADLNNILKIVLQHEFEGKI